MTLFYRHDAMYIDGQTGEKKSEVYIHSIIIKKKYLLIIIIGVIAFSTPEINMVLLTLGKNHI